MLVCLSRGVCVYVCVCHVHRSFSWGSMPDTTSSVPMSSRASTLPFCHQVHVGHKDVSALWGPELDRGR